MSTAHNGTNSNLETASCFNGFRDFDIMIFNFDNLNFNNYSILFVFGKNGTNGTNSNLETASCFNGFWDFDIMLFNFDNPNFYPVSYYFPKYY